MSNPRSRRNRRDPALVGRLGELLADPALHRIPQEVEGIGSAVRALDRAGVTTIGINGGDGTVHHVVSALIRHWSRPNLPTIAILPGGTNNTIARGLGVRGPPDALLERLLHSPATRSTTRQTLRIGDRHGFMFSNGLFARYLQAYDAGPASMFRAVWVLIRAVGSAIVGGAFARHLTAPMRVTVEIDGEPWPDLPWMTLPAATVDDIGLGFRAFPNAPEAVNGFEVLGIASTAFALAFQLPRFYRGIGPRHARIRSTVCTELVLTCTEPFLCALDGDPFLADPVVRVTVGPRLTFLIP